MHISDLEMTALDLVLFSANRENEVIDDFCFHFDCCREPITFIVRHEVRGDSTVAMVLLDCDTVFMHWDRLLVPEIGHAVVGLPQRLHIRQASVVKAQYHTPLESR